MWVILLGILYLYFVFQGNLWGIIVVILATAVLLPGFRRGTPTSADTVTEPQLLEKYKQGDIYGHYSDPLALLDQKKEREKLESEGRKRI
ncbi:hypothetical protein B4U37_19800 [Sutcliffiella horikoshii]|uniref:Uncharacterized protein n=1 Tax=Sutcliffiella horikoshii TaxID=79883 RepID=A0ABN4ZIV8_9BACI|nr:hypothetical protein B4U37_19800 [Sutcliffiella horikoshii]